MTVEELRKLPVVQYSQEQTQSSEASVYQQSKNPQIKEQPKEAPQQSAAPQQEQEPRYLSETEDGTLVWVPQSRLQEWERTQKTGELSPGWKKNKERVIEGILQDIYGDKK